MPRILLLLFSIAFVTAVHADCSGPSTFSALPQDEQAALKAQANAVPYGSGLVWQIEKNGIVSFLVGTLHYPDPRHALLAEEIRPLMAKTKHLYLEITKEREVAFQRRLLGDPSNYMITTGPGLIERLGEENWNVVMERLEPLGIPGFSVSRQQPWFLGLTLSVPPCAIKAMQEGQPGLDRLLETEAKEAGLSISSLDTIDGLISALASDPLEDQVSQLRDAIEAGLMDTDLEPATIIEMYFDQDIQLIWAFTEYEGRKATSDNGSGAAVVASQMNAMEQRLVIERNESWLVTLIAELSESPSTIAVGALHLPGQNGLLAGLEQAGFLLTNIPLDLN